MFFFLKSLYQYVLNNQRCYFWGKDHFGYFNKLLGKKGFTKVKSTTAKSRNFIVPINQSCVPTACSLVLKLLSDFAYMVCRVLSRKDCQILPILFPESLVFFSLSSWQLLKLSVCKRAFQVIFLRNSLTD